MKRKRADSDDDDDGAYVPLVPLVQSMTNKSKRPKLEEERNHRDKVTKPGAAKTPSLKEFGNDNDNEAAESKKIAVVAATAARTENPSPAAGAASASAAAAPSSGSSSSSSSSAPASSGRASLSSVEYDFCRLSVWPMSVRRPHRPASDGGDGSSKGSETEHLQWLGEQFKDLKARLDADRDTIGSIPSWVWHYTLETHNDWARLPDYVAQNDKSVELPTVAFCKMYELLLACFTSRVPTSSLCPTASAASIASARKELARGTYSYTTLHLCEAPGAFVSALLHLLRHRHMKHFLETAEWRFQHKWVASTLWDAKNTQKMDAKTTFIEQTRDHWEFGPDQSGDMFLWTTKQALLDRIGGPGEADLVTGDGSYGCDDDPNAQETKVFPLILSQAHTGVMALGIGGTLILKLFTALEDCTQRLLYALEHLFGQVILTDDFAQFESKSNSNSRRDKSFKSSKCDEVGGSNLAKPRCSKPANSEVYAVCRDFMGEGSLASPRFGGVTRKEAVESKDSKETRESSLTPLQVPLVALDEKSWTKWVQDKCPLRGEFMDEFLPPPPLSWRTGLLATQEALVDRQRAFIQQTVKQALAVMGQLPPDWHKIDFRKRKQVLPRPDPNRAKRQLWLAQECWRQWQARVACVRQLV